MTAKLVFVTGATGFVGSQVVLAILQAGHRVRLSVRRQEQIECLRRTYVQFSDQIDQIVLVPDITNLEFDQNGILDGVDHIFHLASPMPGRGGEDVVTDYINPAVKATEAVLAAAIHQSNIKSVIMMSSHQAITPTKAATQGKKFTAGATPTKKEDTPSDLLGTSFPPGPLGQVLKYQTSKVLAHQACKDFMLTRNPQYRLITIHPVFVLGDSLVQQPKNQKSGSASNDGMNSLLWASLVQSEKPKCPNNWVYLRDVADMHVRLLDDNTGLGAKTVVGGTITELVLSGPVVDWNKVLNT